MKVKDIMTKKVITVKTDDKISTAANLFALYDIGILIVINDNREVLGVLTDRDVVIRGLAKGLDGNNLVEDVMSRASIDIKRDADHTIALEMMGDYQIRRLVVTNDDGKLCGVLSLSDLARGKHTNKFVNETLYEISIPNPQKDKPLKFLRVDDFPL